ncbi:hypothetical protein [Streptomyces sp. G-G2]|nr:hypothetical protein [Streptomyces sp. G-G2]MDJ0381769.1 hypothetical protein [Streptomyces sp. G-G2]
MFFGVGEPLEQGPARHPRLRRVAKSRTRDREDGDSTGPTA